MKHGHGMIRKKRQKSLQTKKRVFMDLMPIIIARKHGEISFIKMAEVS